MKKAFRIIFLTAIAVLFIGTGYFMIKKSQKPPTVYDTKTPFYTDIMRKTVATGSVIPRKEIEIKPRVSGIISEIYVEPGQVLHKGDVIGAIEIIPDMVTLNNAESRVEKAQIAFNDSELEYKRQKQLFDNGVIAEAEFQKAKLMYENSQAELDAAADNLELIKKGVTRKSGQASNTIIRSTIDGMILDVPVEEGNSVIESNTFNAGTTIAVVADMGEMIFEGTVDETEVGKIREGMPLILTIGAIEGETFDAILEYISPKGVEENGAIQFEIRADVKLRDSVFVRAGYSANADIVLENKQNVLAIEESLVTFRSDSAFVEIEESEQQFSERFIEVGISDGINIEVLSGLAESDKIKAGEKKPDEEKEGEEETAENN